MKILAISDLHGKFFRLDAIIRKSDPVDAVVICGDITHGGPEVSAVRTVSELKQFCPTVLYVPGNWDTPEVVEALARYTNAVNLDAGPRVVKDTMFLGMGYSNPTGNNTPGEMSEDEIAAKLKALLTQYPPSTGKTVLVSHAPPLDTLDMTPEGAKGSKALRAALDRVDVILCGHIHKARGKIKDGAWLINPGYAAEGQAAVIDLDTMDVIWIDSVI